MIYWKYLNITILLFCLCAGNAQTRLDTLMLELPGMNGDANKVLQYKHISVEYVKTNLDSSIYYGKLGLKLAKEINNEKLIADLSNNLGIFHKRIGQYRFSFDYYFTSLAIKENLNDKKGIASTRNNIGVVYADINEPDSALSYYQQCLPYYESVYDTSNVTVLQMNIGNTYLLKEKNDDALNWYFLVQTNL